MDDVLIAVLETKGYQSRADRLLSEEERKEISDMLAADPLAGDLLVGGHGIRKIRFGRGHKGKSGGVRVIYYYHTPRVPIFLLDLFAKGEKANLTKAEVAALGASAQRIARGYGQ